MKYHIRCG